MTSSGDELTEDEINELVDRFERRKKDYTDLPSGHETEYAAYMAKVRMLQKYCDLLYQIHGVVFAGHMIHPFYGGRTITPQVDEFRIGVDLKRLLGESMFRSNTLVVSQLVTQIDDFRRGKSTTPPSVYPTSEDSSPFPDPDNKSDWSFVKPYTDKLLPYWSETFTEKWITKRASLRELLSILVSTMTLTPVS